MMRRQAFYGVLADRIRSGNVRIVADWQMEKPHTKTIEALKKALGMRKMLCLAGGPSRTAYLSARNVAGTTFAEVGAVCVSDLLTHAGLVIADDAWKTIEERFASLPKPAKKKEESK
jgi:ribosomal protein L4